MSYKYFENRECEYYPCHRAEHINCLFCFCPFYRDENCIGAPKYLKDGTKDCSGCMVPHRAENYEVIIEKLKQLHQEAKNEELLDL